MERHYKEAVATCKRKWIAASPVPVVADKKDDQAERILPGTDLVLDIKELPRTSYLVLPSRVASKEASTLVVATSTCDHHLYYATTGICYTNNDGSIGLFLCDALVSTTTTLPHRPSVSARH